LSTPIRKKISVILPVFNAAPYVRAGLDSILSQTYADFEILAIDDGSIDESGDILDSYSDPRLRVLHHERNLGLVSTLNEGLAEARGEYAARMDADDISLPKRFARQVAFLDANPEIGLCGSAARRFGADRRRMTVPTDPVIIRCELLFQSPFVHPSVMMRLDALRRHGLCYRESHHSDGRRSGEITTDFDLWRRAADCFPMANIPEVLLRYRVHANSVTVSAAKLGDDARALRSLDIEALSRLGISPTDVELTLHFLMHTTCNAPLEDFEAWLSKLKAANRMVNFYPVREFDQTIARRWFHACHVARGWGLLKWPRMRVSRLSEEMHLSAVDVMKFALRVR
jgi:glycosyltransferase involved in cell wall biosynthesis